jgi:hypothetical protein
MTISHYGCLKLKMPGPWGVIMVATSVAEAYHCEQEHTSCVVGDVPTTDFA